jgi:hypothetical protein
VLLSFQTHPTNSQAGSFRWIKFSDVESYDGFRISCRRRRNRKNPGAIDFLEKFLKLFGRIAEVASHLTIAGVVFLACRTALDLDRFGLWHFSGSQNHH